MEVWPEQVTFLEELGRGAFGKVHKAVLRDSPGVEVFDGKIRGTRVQFKEGRIIAVKVLSSKMFTFPVSCLFICFIRVLLHVQVNILFCLLPPFDDQIKTPISQMQQIKILRNILR